MACPINLEIPPHVWMGVSVENQKYTTRIDDLRRGPFLLDENTLSRTLSAL